MGTGYEAVTWILAVFDQANFSQPMSPEDHLFQLDVLASCHFQLHRSGVSRKLPQNKAPIARLPPTKICMPGVDITQLNFYHESLSAT